MGKKNVVEKEITKHPRRSVLVIILLITLIVAFIGALMQQNWVSIAWIAVLFVILLQFFREPKGADARSAENKVYAGEIKAIRS